MKDDFLKLSSNEAIKLMCLRYDYFKGTIILFVSVLDGLIKIT